MITDLLGTSTFIISPLIHVIFCTIFAKTSVTKIKRYGANESH